MVEKVSKIEAKISRKWEKIRSETRPKNNNKTRCRFSTKMFDFGVGFGTQVGPKSDKKTLSKIDRNLEQNQILRSGPGGGKSKVLMATICRLQTTDCRPVTEDHRSAGLQETIEEDKWQATSNKLQPPAAVCPSQGGASGFRASF